jgi:hypothetical protein
MNIELNNLTPFVPLHFESIDAKLNHFGVVTVRGSFDIQNGKRLSLAGEQESIILEDSYYGDPASSSLRFDSGLSPYKPRTDILVEAISYSPSGGAEASWTASVRAGTLHKRFLVTGPRHWYRKMGIPFLSEIDPILSLPIRYEFAYGGTRSDGEKFPSNPVGIGFEKKLNGSHVPVPQLLPVENLKPFFGQPISPVGLGPIPPSWQPRLQRAGTYDSLWKETRAPYLPRDFSFEFYNVASEGLSFDGFAKGDEIFHLSNLSKNRDLRFGLPNIELISIIQFDDGRIIPGPMNLDTIEIEVERSKVFLQWRGIFPAQMPIRAVDVRMSAPESMVEA